MPSKIYPKNLIYRKQKFIFVCFNFDFFLDFNTASYMLFKATFAQAQITEHLDGKSPLFTPFRTVGL
jgi:hypothetical protein